ncbi:hypothetical protein LDG_8606 [Legionella drancourtii LLAP12]|uniref:Uncharacterized protein n=1 Tax=Legionella drancourtii LLAP12 TaxID=658187 RepID=G9ETH4_9GAMM|nr:hypothetical protein LDG_8606 [Legionella drancourtii LLAP12]
MVAPGLWNQIKTHINNVLEKYRIRAPLFNAVKSDLALKNDLRMRYTELKAMYASAEDEKKSCCLGL